MCSANVGIARYSLEREGLTARSDVSASHNIGQQFEQLPLYTHEQSSWPPVMEPHMMSPEQFDTDPDTVFHASYRRLPEQGESYRSSFNGIHAGTEQSALERISRMGRFSAWNVVRPDVAGYSQGKREEENLDEIAQGLRADEGQYDPPRAMVHAINLKRYGINNVQDPLTDNEANSLHGFVTPHAYTNDIEDKDSLSVVMPGKYFGPLTHRQYVREAIRQGRSAEIHPTTRAAYDAGALSTDKAVDPQEIDKTLSQENIHAQHSEGLFPFEDSWGPHPLQRRLLSREEVEQLAGPYAGHPDPDEMDKQWLRVNKRFELLRTYGDRARMSDDEDTYSNLKGITPATVEGLTKLRLSELGDIRRGRQFRPQDSDAGVQV